ncbi:MAG: hypothetical protein A2Z04_06075 [Chloroflexi bacterium RBG_16_57_9]|nr:MAG: hypothetical protein A2Z04_06075 [Chloroflexi bacterium RBG_16_57_9]
MHAPDGLPVDQRRSQQWGIPGLHLDVRIVHPALEPAGATGRLLGPTLHGFAPAGQTNLFAEAQPDDGPRQGHQAADIAPCRTGNVLHKGVHQGTEHLAAVCHRSLRNKILEGYYTIITALGPPRD